MTKLAGIITAIQANLATSLNKWEIQGETILGAHDKMVEVRFGQFTIKYLDMDTQSFTGTIEIAFYRQYGETYTSLMTDVETAVAGLAGLNVPDVQILNQGSTFATVRRPEILATRTQSFYVITINLNFESII